MGIRRVVAGVGVVLLGAGAFALVANATPRETAPPSAAQQVQHVAATPIRGNSTGAFRRGRERRAQNRRVTGSTTTAARS